MNIRYFRIKDVLLGVGLVVFIIVVISVKEVKMKKKRATVDTLSQSGNKSSAYNNDLLGPIALCFMIAMSLGVIAAMLFADSDDILNNPNSILAKIINYSVAYVSVIVVMVLLPGVVVTRNPKIRQFAKGEIQDMFLVFY